MNKKETIYIYGTHAVTEAVARKPELVKLLLVASGQEHTELINKAKKLGIQIGAFDRNQLPKTIDPHAVHQGVIAEVVVSDLIQEYDTFMSTHEVGKDSCIVLLQHIEDPQNMGSIIRSAAAFGVSAIFFPEHKQTTVTSSVVKVSAGMAFRVPLVQIGNVGVTLKDLKERGYWVYGLEGNSKTKLSSEDFSVPTVLIVGNEGNGIREKTQENCDVLLSIPMHPHCESLNAAVSTTIALYEWSKHHPDALST